MMSMAQPPDRVSLRHYLLTFESFLHQEDAWALCYQVIKFAINSRCKLRPIDNFDDVYIRSDGSVSLTFHSKDTPISEGKFLFHLGAVLFKSLYYGLAENEVRELQPSLENLLDKLTYDADENDDDSQDIIAQHHEPVTLDTILKLCENHLPQSTDANIYYRDLCSALYTEATLDLKLLLKVASYDKELRSFGDQIDTYSGDSIRDDVKFEEWACLWIQVVRDLKDGVKLRKVDVNYNKNSDYYDLTPYEKLLRDIRDRNYNLRHIDAQSIENMKKDAHALILELIRTRPKLVPASQRVLRPEPVKTSTIHEKLMQEVRSCPKLRHIDNCSSSLSSLSITPTPHLSPLLNVHRESPSPKRRLIKADIDLTLSCSIDAQQLKQQQTDDTLLNYYIDTDTLSTIGTAQKVINNNGKSNVNLNNNNNNNRQVDRRSTSLLYKAFARLLNLDLSITLK